MKGQQYQQNRIPAPNIHEFGITGWLNEAPAEDEIEFKDYGNDRIRKFLPYNRVLKGKLDHLCPDTWDTCNFHHFFFYLPDKRVKVSGNIEVVVKYNYWLEDKSAYREVYRRLAGAATFFAEDYGHNEHWGPTVKSLCIANAVQVLGQQFGWGLNPDEEEDTYSPAVTQDKAITRNGKVSVLLSPDHLIKTKYLRAVADGDIDTMQRLEKVYNFNLSNHA